MATETSALVALSNDIAATVERTAPGVVAVEGRARLGSSGFYVRPDLILTADHALESDEVEVVGADGQRRAGDDRRPRSLDRPRPAARRATPACR